MLRGGAMGGRREREGGEGRGESEKERERRKEREKNEKKQKKKKKGGGDERAVRLYLQSYQGAHKGISAYSEAVFYAYVTTCTGYHSSAP